MDTESLGQLYVTHAPRARSLAYLLVGDAQVAEDVVHDCFLRLASRWRPVDDPAAYLRRMVINASNSHHRRSRLRRDRSRDEAWVLGAESDVTEDGSAGRAQRAELLAALDVLPHRQRAAVVLRHWLDLSEAQCAAELGCSIGTVKSLASRGRATLREVLEPR